MTPPPTSRKSSKRADRVAELPGGRRGVLADDVGRVTVEGGRTGLCEIGFALRLGLGRRPDPEVARALFPLLELAPGETRPLPGEEIAGWPVVAWIRQQDAAALLGITPRQVQNLDGRGLPSKGRRESRRYPLPHLVMWYASWALRGGSGRSVDRLPMAVALAEHELRMAEDHARTAELALAASGPSRAS